MSFPPTGMGGGLPVGPHGAPPTQKQGQAILIWTIGAFCTYGWEFFVCLPKEYRIIWSRPMNLSSVLYIANRYFGLIQFAIVVTLATDVWKPSACSRIFYFEPIGALISIALCQMIVGGRVYAIFSQSKLIGIALGVILVAELVVGGVATSNIRHPPSIPIGTPGLPPDYQPPPCGALTGPFKWQVTYWTLPLLYDTLTFLLTAWKAHSFWKNGLRTNLFDIIWRDGLLYFFAILSMNIINVIFFLAAPNGIRTINLPATIMLEIMLSCRLVLNLRSSHTQSVLHPNLMKTSKSFTGPTKASKWSFSTNARSTSSHSDSPDINLEVYGKVPLSGERINLNSEAGYAV